MKKRIDIDTTLHTDPKFDFLSKEKHKKFKNSTEALFTINIHTRTMIFFFFF